MNSEIVTNALDATHNITRATLFMEELLQLLNKHHIQLECSEWLIFTLRAAPHPSPDLLDHSVVGFYDDQGRPLNDRAILDLVKEHLVKSVLASPGTPS